LYICCCCQCLLHLSSILISFALGDALSFATNNKNNAKDSSIKCKKIFFDYLSAAERSRENGLCFFKGNFFVLGLEGESKEERKIHLIPFFGLHTIEHTSFHLSLSHAHVLHLFNGIFFSLLSCCSFGFLSFYFFKNGFLNFCFNISFRDEIKSAILLEASGVWVATIILLLLKMGMGSIHQVPLLKHSRCTQ
jgi:hypothetical protein